MAAGFHRSAPGIFAAAAFVATTMVVLSMSDRNKVHESPIPMGPGDRGQGQKTAMSPRRPTGISPEAAAPGESDQTISGARRQDAAKPAFASAASPAPGHPIPNGNGWSAATAEEFRNSTQPDHVTGDVTSPARRPERSPGSPEGATGSEVLKSEGEADAAAASPVPVVVPFSVDDPERPATIPAALAEEAAGSPLTDLESAEAARAAEAFFHYVEAGPTDPRDPARQQVWFEAQEGSDARLRASLGGHAWMQRHRDAQRQAREAMPDASSGQER